MVKAIFAEFDTSLGHEESLWHDYNLEVSSSLLKDFSSDDWIKLKEEIFFHPAYWQARCAEAIGYMENENGVNILIAVINSPHISVAAIAASELDNMKISLPKTYKEKLLQLLKCLQENRDNRIDEVKRLIERLE
ncbi:hypothetical protein PO883_34070 [Massilia sp. DJPM01]|uniref:hypothetical protein n=1 Tax=Massilia sp. DJPM01 TaxID=3024404 RepID=UPI00259F028E|nr:hypothetical protein [Massilia sp. DJPM01]MDM5182197.1 hypothetical protein [Massilia sp. DJPM01]